MNVTANDDLDLGVLGYQRLQLGISGKRIFIQSENSGLQRRMMHENESRSFWLFPTSFVQPLPPCLAYTATDLSGNSRVEPDQPQRKLFNDIMKRASGPRKIPMIGKRLLEIGSVVMIAGDDEIGNAQQFKTLPEFPVCGLASVIRQVTG